jgi:hypothetical protein
VGSTHDLFTCGVSGAAGCAGGARNFYTGSHYLQITGCNPTTGSANEVWTVIWSGAYAQLLTDGPSNPVTLSSNLASQHALVCSGL